MTTYTTITNAEIDQDSPVTQPLMTALRDNPLAISEGDSTAPAISGKALDTFISSISIGVSSNTQIDLTNYRLIRLHGAVQRNGAGSKVTAELSANGGSTWASSVDIVDLDSVTLYCNLNYTITINLSTGAFYTCGSIITYDSGTGIYDFGNFRQTGTVTLPTGTVNRIRIGTSNNVSTVANIYGG